MEHFITYVSFSVDVSRFSLKLAKFFTNYIIGFHCSVPVGRRHIHPDERAPVQRNRLRLELQHSVRQSVCVWFQERKAARRLCANETDRPEL